MKTYCIVHNETRRVCVRRVCGVCETCVCETCVCVCVCVVERETYGSLYSA